MLNYKVFFTDLMLRTKSKCGYFSEVESMIGLVFIVDSYSLLKRDIISEKNAAQSRKQVHDVMAHNNHDSYACVSGTTTIQPFHTTTLPSRSSFTLPSSKLVPQIFIKIKIRTNKTSKIKSLSIKGSNKKKPILHV